MYTSYIYICTIEHMTIIYDKFCTAISCMLSDSLRNKTYGVIVLSSLESSDMELWWIVGLVKQRDPNQSV